MNYKYEIAKRLIRNMRNREFSVKPRTIEKQYMIDEEVTNQFNQAAAYLWKNELIDIELFDLGDTKTIKKISIKKGKELDLLKTYLTEK